MRRWIALENSLAMLRRVGVEVETVIDVGVQYDTKVLRVGYPDVPHILFEPVEEYHDAIRANYADVDYRLVGAAVGGRDGPLHLRSIRTDAETGTVSHVANAETAGSDTRQVPCVTLDSFVAGQPVASPYLIKVDVDGAEIDILRGAAEALRRCSVLIVETTLPTLHERCVLAAASGLRLWDIVDFNFYHGNLYQADLVFVHQDQIDRCPILDPYETINLGFDRSAWYEH